MHIPTLPPEEYNLVNRAKNHHILPGSGSGCLGTSHARITYPTQGKELKSQMRLVSRI